MPPAAADDSGSKVSYLVDEAKTDLRKLAGSFSTSRAKVGEPTDDDDSNEKKGKGSRKAVVQFQKGTKQSTPKTPTTKMDFLLEEAKSDLRKFAGSISPAGFDYGENGNDDSSSGIDAQKALRKKEKKGDSGGGGGGGGAKEAARGKGKWWKQKTIKLSKTDSLSDSDNSIQRGAAGGGAKLQEQNSKPGCGTSASHENAADTVGGLIDSAATDLIQSVSNLFSCGGGSGCAPISTQDDDADGEVRTTTVGVKAESVGKDKTPEGQGNGSNVESKATNNDRRRKVPSFKGLKRKLSSAAVKRKS